MFNIFRKAKKQKPVFKELARYLNKDKYFYRVAQWRRLDKNVIWVIDPNQPRVLALDPWPQLVFLAADGRKTIAQYVDYMADQYSDEIPQNLDVTVIDEIDQLVDERLIKLADGPIELSNDFLLPKDKQRG